MGERTSSFISNWPRSWFKRDSSQGRRVDRLMKGDQVCIVFAENIGKFQKVTGVSGQSGKIGKDEAADVAGFDVLEHPLGLRKADDRLAAHCLKMVDLFDLPAFGPSVEAGALLVMLRAFALGLIFGGDPDPNAN